MLGVRVTFTESDEIKVLAIRRPYFTIGMPLMLVLAVASHFLLEPDLVNVLVWCALVYVNLENAEETFSVRCDEVRVSRGFWRLKRTESFNRSDISKVSVTTSKSCEERGVMGFYSPLNLTIAKRRRNFIRGASMADAKVVAQWLDHA